MHHIKYIVRTVLLAVFLKYVNPKETMNEKYSILKSPQHAVQWVIHVLRITRVFRAVFVHDGAWGNIGNGDSGGHSICVQRWLGSPYLSADVARRATAPCRSPPLSARDSIEQKCDRYFRRIK